MFKLRSVVPLMIAALVTGVVEVVGLHRAAQLWNARAAEAPCPNPPAAEVPDVSAADAEPPSPEPRDWAHRIGWLSVRADAVELDVDGRRMELPGYPAPRSEHHARPRLTTVAFTPDGKQIAIAGDCYGESGTVDQKVPSCVPKFVRLYRVEDGAHVRDLRMPWRLETEMERRVLAMVFDEHAERLAVLVTTFWEDCSWAGDVVQLVVYRIADGARLMHRDLGTPDSADGVRDFRFDDDEVRLLLPRPNARPKLHVVRLRKPNAT